MNNFHTYDFDGKRALVRVDFNVPLDENQQVTDNTRIKAAIPTILNITLNGGVAVLVSHLGRPNGAIDPKLSLKPIALELKKLTGRKILFAKQTVGKGIAQAIKGLKPGQILLLENLRFHPEEKKGDKEFAKQLADLGCDVYVNDAFGTAHRAHASTSVVADFFDEKDVLGGYLMSSEIKSAQKVLDESEKPFVAILGGAKVSDKIQLIENLMDRASHIVIGGAMAYTFSKAAGGKVGNSLVEDDKIALAKELVKKAKEKGVELVLPVDTVIANKFANDAQKKVVDSGKIPDGWEGLDIGPKSSKLFNDLLVKAKTVLWNGPMGVFEFENFAHGTKSVAESVGKATQNGAFSLIGGGDSVAAIKKYGLENNVSHISTGGGALLEFFEGKELPGIKALG